MLDQDLTDDEKEHCTLKIFNSIKESKLPNEFKVHTVMNEYDMSNLKTSIDTQEEYDFAISLLDNFNEKRREATIFGTVSI
jgi:spore coat polysaccharide biosynthesis protein SpsF (cytidylyltransferase family)